MKKILIVYPYMMVGGSTTSLLSLLRELDYSKYVVDLAMLNNNGELHSLIPSVVKILPPFLQYSVGELKQKKQKSVISILYRIHCIILDIFRKNHNAHMQIMSLDTLRYTRPQMKEYDVAISYLEGLPLYYMVKNVKAKRKIAWIHVDYKEACLCPKIDRRFLEKVDNVVLVSNSCKRSFDEVFKDLTSKSVVINNILSQAFVRSRSNDSDVERNIIFTYKYKLITVCRISLKHKGLLRGVFALSEIKRSGVAISNLIWYIIGGGNSDEVNQLKKAIQQHGLEKNIVLLGEFKNPMPIVKQCDVFFLPSYYEGKPMAVTEAQMIGVVPIVTRYASADSQIKNMETGIIIDNTDNAIFEMLNNLVKDKYDIGYIKNNLLSSDFSNIDEVNKVQYLLDA